MSRLIAIVALGMALVFPLSAHTATKPSTHRLSNGSGGADSNGESASARISANGRWIAFASDATNLVEGDGNGHRDVFVSNVGSGKPERVSVSSSGAEADGDSLVTVIDINGGPAISGDGRYVAFQSAATNLVDGDTNGAGDVFLRDRKKRTTTRVSVGSSNAQADGPSFHPALSPNGRWLVFASSATNLVPGDTNGQGDIFLRDLRRRKTLRVTVSSKGAQANNVSLRPTVSHDGRLVVYESFATNLAGPDANDDKGGLDRMDVFARDVKSRRTQRISVSSSNASGDSGSFSGFAPSISRNRRYVVFDSDASNLVRGDSNGVFDVFVRDLRKKRTTRVSLGPGKAQGDGHSGATTISANGRYVAFESNATTLSAGGHASTDVYVRDRKRGKTTRVSVGAGGAQPDGPSLHASIAAGGHAVSFASYAGNLVSGDANGLQDVFVRRLR